MAVRVVTDSTAYLPQDILTSLAIERVSLSVMWSDRSEQEVEITDFASFYDDLREMTNLPTTSQPSVGQFLDVYRPILERGDEIVSVHLASAISGTFDAACQATAQLQREGVDAGQVAVIDSQRACGGLGLMAVAAATAAKHGADLAGVTQAVREMREGLDFWFVIDTLEYLRRGGRIGGAQALIGGAMKIKPILTVGAEGIVPVDKVRTQTRALDRLLAMGVQSAPAEPGFVVQHIQAPELAAKVADRCRAEFGGEPLFCNEIGPVIGAHVGPGLIGMAVYPAALVALADDVVGDSRTAPVA